MKDFQVMEAEIWVGHFLAEIVAEKSDLMSTFLIGIASPQSHIGMGNPNKE